MTYKKLEGKLLNIKGRDVLVNSILDISDGGVNGSTFRINDNITLSQFDVGMLLNEVEFEEEIESHNKFQAFKKRYGIFFIREENEDKSLLYRGSIKLRTYGFHKCSISFGFILLKHKVTFEFVFRDKELYESGEMYDNLLTPTKLF